MSSNREVLDLGLCHPLLNPQSRKSWFYVVPVVFFAVLLNVPKFLVSCIMQKSVESLVNANGTNFLYCIAQCAKIFGKLHHVEKH